MDTTIPLETALAAFAAERLAEGERDDLRNLLAATLDQAVRVERSVMTVMNPTSRPRPLRLAVLARDDTLDQMYQQEWCELALADDGRPYLVYRRRDGGDYAVAWSPSTPLPASLLAALPAALLGAVDGDGA